MNRTPLALSLALGLSLAGGAFAHGDDVDKVNGSISIPGDQRAGNLTTVNGSIHIEGGGTAQKVSTVNGGITVGARATVDSLETVNGGVELGDGARVGKTVEAVNGSVQLGKGADVAGHVSNVNGRFTLDAAHIGGGIETVSGDIEIGADSHVEGGLIVDKPHGWSWGKSRNPRIVIGPRAVVTGTLDFRRDVDLFISDSAKVGTVTGATATKFSGDHP
ncbi:MAG TPA: hypothetical protein VGC55_01435 [Dokdonella sp.]